MLTPASRMFLLIPGSSLQRELHPGTVLESDAKSFLAEFDEEIVPTVGSDVNVYAEVRGKFYQQGAKVVAIREAGAKPVIAFSREGTPVSAESRSSFRVSVATCGIQATVGTRRGCLVVDMSVEGLALVTGEPLQIGAVYPLTMAFGGQEYTGDARVQGLRRLPNGTFRYGMRPAEGSAAMRKALQQVSTEVQRRQLRRLARSA